MRLRVLAATWLEQDKSPDTIALTFDERFALLVDAEMLARENARLAKNLRDAKLRIADACIEGIDFARERQLDKSTMSIERARRCRDRQIERERGQRRQRERGKPRQLHRGQAEAEEIRKRDAHVERE